MCVCGRKEEYEACCGRFIAGVETPERAEELMRSRYAAYVLGHIDYVAATQDFGTATYDQDSARAWSTSAVWLGLEVLTTEHGEPGDATGWVEFKARYILNEQLETLSERSYFRRQGDGWIYGLEKSKSEVARKKIPRNGPCPCGSGKKFKRCGHASERP